MSILKILKKKKEKLVQKSCSEREESGVYVLHFALTKKLSTEFSR